METGGLRAWFYKNWRYAVAYFFFAVFALIGLAVTWGLRTNVLELALLFNVHPQTIHILRSWGSYLVFLPYVFLIGLLEPYLNQAAKRKQLSTPLFKISAGLAAAGLVSLGISWICALLIK